jgi:GAF domain-containing protein
VVFCLRDTKTHAMVARLGAGAWVAAEKDPARLRFALGDMTNFVASAVFKAEDLWFSDAVQPSSEVPPVPAHWRQASGAHSVLLLPLHLKGQPLALVYADCADPPGVPLGSKELALMATLRNQVALAFRQRSF